MENVGIYNLEFTLRRLMAHRPQPPLRTVGTGEVWLSVRAPHSHTLTHTETCTTACIVPSRTTEPTDTPLSETFVSENGGREERLLYILL